MNQNSILSNLISEGDYVILDRYYKAEDEFVDWSLKDGIPLNTPVEVSWLHEPSGSLNIKGFKYSHPVEKFRKATI